MTRSSWTCYCTLCSVGSTSVEVYPLLGMEGNGAQIAAVTRNGPQITVSEFAQSNSTIEAFMNFLKRVVAYVLWFNFTINNFLLYGNILKCL